MWFAPKIASILDVLARPEARRAFGGGGRFLLSAAIETGFFILLCPIQWCSHTVFLGGLALGRTVGWNPQVRHAHAVSLADAIARLWPQTVIGWASIGALVWTNPTALPVALLIAGGLALAVPMAVVTAAPRVGRLLARLGIGQLPEETDRPRHSAGVGASSDPPQAACLTGCAASPACCARCASTTAVRSARTGMDELYAQFVHSGDLVFDIGAHVGDRIGAFRRLGARVVAVEPQPAPMQALRLLYGRDGAVALEPVAIGAAAGQVELYVNLDNPTVSSCSKKLVQAAATAPGWSGERWDKSISVPDDDARSAFRAPRRAGFHQDRRGRI